MLHYYLFAVKQEACHEILNNSPADFTSANSVCEAAGHHGLATFQTQPDFDAFVKMIE